MITLCGHASSLDFFPRLVKNALMHQQHLECSRLDVLLEQAIRTNNNVNDWHHGLTSPVPSDPASSQGSEADSNSDTPGVRRIQLQKYRELQPRILSCGTGMTRPGKDQQDD